MTTGTSRPAPRTWQSILRCLWPCDPIPTSTNYLGQRADGRQTASSYISFSLQYVPTYAAYEFSKFVFPPSLLENQPWRAAKHYDHFTCFFFFFFNHAGDHALIRAIDCCLRKFLFFFFIQVQRVIFSSSSGFVFFIFVCFVICSNLLLPAQLGDFFVHIFNLKTPNNVSIGKIVGNNHYILESGVTPRSKLKSRVLCMHFVYHQRSKKIHIRIYISEKSFLNNYCYVLRHKHIFKYK